MASSSLFRHLLGASFERLPAGIRQVHAGHPSLWFEGACAIERGRHWLARLSAVIAGMPPATAQVDLRIEIAADAAGETWNRHFGERLMSSRMHAVNGLLVERLGPLTIAFQLEAADQQIRWNPRAGRILGVPLPAAFFKGVVACESMIDGRYHFDVRAALPLMGLVIHYRGWLRTDG